MREQGPAEAGHYHRHYIYALKQDLSRTRTTTREVAPEDEDIFSRIRCPLCEWLPAKEELWSCDCGNNWHTFDTGGVCPSCLQQWVNTQCHRCAGWSAHSDWYEY